MKTCFTIGIAALVLLSIVASATSQSDNSTSCSEECHGYAECYNNYCRCISGFTGNGTYCEDIDECDYVNCTEYATCYNTVGSYICQCDAGFTGDGVNTCSDNSTSCSEECHDYAQCYNNYCTTCISGFTGNGTYCEDIDECYYDYDNCHQYATCYNTVGSFFCQCDAGFTGDGVNTCSDNSTSCSEECHDYAQCYNNYCTCIYGFTGNGTYCEDIDECDYVNCTEYATCYNTVGSYICQCDAGFTGYGGYYCYAISPCYNNPCGENAYCAETNGSYTCNCQYGYTGNGTACTSLCPDCGPNAYCTGGYEENEYVCRCYYGYTGDPTNYCYDIDECETGEYCQVEYAYCNNTDGSFTCICSSGYYYSRIVDECIAIERDEPYRAEAVVVPGCNESANAQYRYYLQYKVQALLSEYFYATSQYDSDDGSRVDSGY